MKRAYSFATYQGCCVSATMLQVETPASQLVQQCPYKRACGFTSLGAMACRDVARQTALMGLQLPLGAAAGGVSARMWAAFAELNHLLAAHPHAIRGNR
jgi:hypothetical protein